MPLPFPDITWLVAEEKLTGTPQALPTSPNGNLNRPLDQLQQNIVYLEGLIGGGGSTDFVSLTDTPGSITANQFVRGNAGGTALEFIALDHDVHLSGRDGSGPEYNHISNAEKSLYDGYDSRVTSLEASPNSIMFPSLATSFSKRREIGVLSTGADLDIFTIDLSASQTENGYAVSFYVRIAAFEFKPVSTPDAILNQWRIFTIQRTNALGFHLGTELDIYNLNTGLTGSLDVTVDTVTGLVTVKLIGTTNAEQYSYSAVVEFFEGTDFTRPIAQP